MMKDFLKSPKFLIILLSLYLCFLMGKSMVQILDEDRNDFEVFTMAGQAALERDSSLYDLRSPVEERPYIYPAGASVWLIPIAVPPFSVTAALWTILKAAAIALLFVACAKILNREFETGFLWVLILLGVLITRQPVDNDFSNGQINTFVAATGILGTILTMRKESPRWLAGAFLLALSVTIKLTPLILLAVPFLYKKWRPFFATLGFLFILIFVVPAVWYGWDNSQNMNAEYSDRTKRLMKNPLDKDRQISLSEMITFTQGQLAIDEEVIYDDRELFTENNGEQERYRVRNEVPFDLDRARLIWFVTSFLIGMGYLVVRWQLFKGQSHSWLWDLAVLCALSVLLSPLVRRAHLVILVFPFLWMIAYWMAWVRIEGWQVVKRLKIPAAFTLLTIFFWWMNEDVPLPVFVMPYFPMIFVSLICMLAFFAFAARSIPVHQDGPPKRGV